MPLGVLLSRLQQLLRLDQLLIVRLDALGLLYLLELLRLEGRKKLLFLREQLGLARKLLLQLLDLPIGRLLDELLLLLQEVTQVLLLDVDRRDLGLQFLVFLLHLFELELLDFLELLELV